MARKRSQPVWVFGYGSLVWRPDFPYVERRPAHVRGWIRRFWQGSTDHRGTPGAPGRVVTLLPDDEHAVCWGMAYLVSAQTVPEVVSGLDFRERGGYARHEVQLRFQPDAAASTTASGTVYIATPDNENYLGPAEPAAIASQIARSRGPSGHNVEYLLELARALRALAADDDHVFDLERRVLALTGRVAPA